MNANEFFNFWEEKVQKQKSISNECFEEEICKNDELYAFLKKAIENVEKKKLNENNSDKVLNRNNLTLITPIRSVSNIKRSFSKAFNISNEPKLLNNQPTSSSLTSISSPKSASSAILSFDEHPALHNTDKSLIQNGLCLLDIKDDDWNLDIDKLSKKYKLHYLKAVEIIINKNIVKLDKDAITNFANCYFKVDINYKNYQGSCQWTMQKGWGGSHWHNISIVPSENGLIPKKIGRFRKDEFPNSFPLIVRHYHAKCKSKYIRYDYIFQKTILVLFIGKPCGTSMCCNVQRQKSVIEENKDLSTCMLYHKYNNLFRSKKTINNLRNSTRRKSSANRNLKKLTE